MFSDEELELIEEILTSTTIDDWIQTMVERRRVDAILAKIDGHLNG